MSSLVTAGKRPMRGTGRPVISAGRSKSDESWVRGKAWHGWNGHLSDRPTVIPKKNDHCSAAICSLPPLPAGGFLQRQYTVASSTNSHGLHSTPAIEAMTRTTPVYMRTMTTVDSTFIARSDIGGLPSKLSAAWPSSQPVIRTGIAREWRRCGHRCPCLAPRWRYRGTRGAGYLRRILLAVFDSRGRHYTE